MNTETVETPASLDSPFTHLLVDSIPTPILIIKNGRFYGCNRAAIRLFKSQDKSFFIGKDLLGISASTQSDGSDSAIHASSMLSRIVPGENLNIEWRFSRADNSIFDGKGTLCQAEPEIGDYVLFSIIDNSAEASAIRDVLALSEEMKKGNLRARLSPEGYHGDLGTMLIQINSMLDDILHPFRDINKVLVQISRGDINSRIEHSFQGEHERIRGAVHAVADGIVQLQTEILRLTDAARSGSVTERGRPELFQGAYADTITEINEMLDTIVNPIRQGYRILKKIRGGDLSDRVEIQCIGDHAKLRDAINDLHTWLSSLIVYVTKISEGDMSASIEKSSDKDQIYGPLTRMRDNIRSLIQDVEMMETAALEGELTVRADTARHQGEFRKIVDGINKTMDSVISPVHEAMKVSECYADYNFSRRVDPSLMNDGEWAGLKEALDNVAIHVSEAVRIIQIEAKNLDSSVSLTNASISDISQGAATLAHIAQTVSMNAELGKDGITQILRAMEDLATNVSSVSARTDEVNTLVTNTNALSEKGSQLAKGADSGMNEITDSTTQVVGLVHEIMDEMKEINKITKVISDIASQTNLLALNAAIEAARAGEAGRGFAVVASEVKSLALESRQSAENITGMIEILEKKTELASATMDKSAESVRHGGKALSETLKVFNEIIEAISTISERMDEVARAAEQQAATVEEISASVQEVNDKVTDTSKEAIASAAASEQASAAADELSTQAVNVHAVLTRLSLEMGKFTI